MNEQQSPCIWTEANGGLRGSPFLRWGAVGYFLSSLIYFLVPALSSQPLGPGNPVFLAAISFWVVTLMVIGSGFIWTGIHPFMSRFGIAVGVYAFLQAGYLILSLIKPELLAFPPSILTMGRTFLVGLFALIERRYIGPKATWLLGLGSALQLVRVVLRAVGPYPSFPPALETIISTTFMAITALGLWLAARAIHKQEMTWAKANQPQRNAHFTDFNNPGHRWNKMEREEQA